MTIRASIHAPFYRYSKKRMNISKMEYLLDRDIVWNDRENNNFVEINFDNNHNDSFDLILNQSIN